MVPPYFITLSVRASTLGEIAYPFWIFDGSTGSPQVLDTSTEFILSGVEGLSTGFRLVVHRITLSALAKTLGGIVNPICL
ncbi:MAG TPA: hypothetical protein VI585_21890, partial [Candidatus Binatia bacterium]